MLRMGSGAWRSGTRREFFDPLFSHAQDFLTAIDKFYAPFVLGEGFFKPDLAPFDSLDDGFEFIHCGFKGEFGRVGSIILSGADAVLRSWGRHMVSVGSHSH